MKNLKKVLALVLAFACAFTMFAGAVVYPDVPAGSEYSEAITMLSDLGIIQGKDDGKYHSEDTITRAEACALIARMLTGDPQVSQYAGASNFTDVVKGSWKESVVGYCVVNGITVGVGNNKFEPDRAITDAEFVTMVVRAMGYETTGTSYPYGHISAAQANGLLDDVTVVPSSAALRGEDAQIIYNALFADYARGAKQVNTTHGTTVEEYPTIAEDVFGLSRAAVGTPDKNGDLKTCKAHTWVIVGESCEKGKPDTILAYPITDDKTTLYKDGKVGAYEFTYTGDVDGLIGYQVELWGEGKHSEPEWNNKSETYTYSEDWEIAAIKTVKGQTAYEYNSTEDIPDVDYDEVRLVNRTVNTKDEDGIEDMLEAKDATKYVLIDWDSDESLDYIRADYTAYAKVTAITSKQVKIDFVNPDITDRALDKDGETTLTINNVERKVTCELPEDLEKDDIVAVTFACNATKKDAVSTWTMEIVEPETKELTDVEAKSGKAYFDGDVYKCADDNFGAKAVYDDLDEDSETNWDLWLDANGYILKMEEADSEMGYLLVTGQGNGSKATNSRKLAKVDVVYADGKSAEDVEIVKDADIFVQVWNGTKFVETDAMTDDYTFNDTYPLVGRAFKYKANDDGQITKLTQVAATPVEKYDYDKDDEILNINSDNTKANDIWMDDCEVIFVIKADNDVTNETVTNTPAVAYAADDQIKAKNVKVVDYSKLPDIAAKTTTESNLKTYSRGVQYDPKTDTMKSAEKVAVLGVNTFKYFDDVDSTIALVSEVKYTTSSSKYTVSAIIPGEGEETFTGKVGDLDDGSIDDLDEAKDKLTTGNKEMIYAELELVDGEVVAFNLLDASADDMADEEMKDYKVGRVVLTKYTSSSNKLHLSKAEYTGTGAAAPTISVVSTLGAYGFADEVAYYELSDKDDDNNLPKNPARLGNNYATTDGFLTDSVKKLSESAGVSYYNDDDTDENEYYMADVVLDDDDKICMIVYFPEVIEAKKLVDSIRVVNYNDNTKNTLTYGDTITNTDASNYWFNVVDEKADHLMTSDITVAAKAGTPIAAQNLVKLANFGGTEAPAWADLVVDPTVASTVPAGTYTFVVTETATTKTTELKITVEKASAEVVSAEYDNDAVKIVLSNEKVAKEVAEKPELITIKKGKAQVVGTAVRQGAVTTCVVVKVDMSNITSTDPVVVSIADTDNFAFGTDNQATAVYSDVTF